METVGFIGLGTIGGVIATHILEAGYPMMVYDLRAEATQPFAEKGVACAGSPAEVARYCRFALTSLPGPREVEEVALGSDGLVKEVSSGSVYIDLSSSSPEVIERIETEFRPRGAKVIDAPLIVGKKGVTRKNVQVLASGDGQVFQTAKPLLESFSDTVVYTGRLGTGTVIKLAHNLVRRGIGLAIGEGMVLGAKADVDPQLLWNCMRWGLEVQLHQLEKTFPEIVFEGKYEAPAAFGIGLARKDVGLATELGRRYNVPMPIAALVEQILVQALGRGWSDQSTISLFRLQEEAAGIEVRKRPERDGD